MSNKNKSLIVILIVLTIGLVGVTIAYFSNSTSIDNTFKTKEYGTTTDEDFVSPNNWLPGDTEPKTLTVTNSGNVDEAVRISYTETWTSKNAKDNDQEGDLPLKQNNNDVAIINWANTDDWSTVTENGVTYKYYKYKLAPTETTTSLLESVTFNSAAVNNSNCVETTPEPGKKVITCDSTGNGYDGATYKLRFNVETVQYNQYQTAWGTSVVLLDEKPLPTPSGAEYLASSATNAANAEYNADTKKKMFTFTHGEGTNAITETRYIGDDPNNYVYFNCDDMSNQSASTCEVWRILGVFDVDDGTGNIEQRMKLVRGSDLATTRAYHGTDYSSSKNDWTISDLKTFLNGDYYNASGDALAFGLKASARSIIDDAKYYLGAVSYNSGFGSTEKIYGEERGNTVCGACNSDTTKLTWTGSVGLMYPSDEYMVYGNGVNDTCYTDPIGCNGSNAQTGWVYKSNVLEGQTSPDYTWFLSSRAGHWNYVLRAYSDGGLYSGDSFGSIGVRPVVYLKSEIKITEGTGEEGSPYKLGL